MNYDLYSKLEFEKRGHGTDEAFKLAAELKVELLAELNELIKQRLLEVALELNNRGHDLTEDHKNYTDCICVREVGEEKNRVPGLILAVDIVISAGYPLTLNHEDLKRIDD